MVRGDGRHMAILPWLRWVLSEPGKGHSEETAIHVVSARSSLMLRVDSSTEPECLDAGLKRLWELESLGILKEEHPVQQPFSQQITFTGEGYQVCLPWKDFHLQLPDNYNLHVCKK